MLSSDALEPYIKGLEVWVPHTEEGWKLATIQSKDLSGTHVTLETRTIDEGDTETHKFELARTEATELPPLRNPKVLDGADDLTSLSYLHEPAVLNNIRIRYAQHNIYTYSGIVLIAMNPFYRVQLYAPELMTAYSGKRRGELEPHLFAIAEESFRDMIQEQRNETIVVSGESGAGKTVSAKYIMRYFATVATQSGGKSLVNDGNKRDDRGTEIEEKIMATNPILESFGNAKTTRNDNSSRFGKYIQIHFDKQAYIVGATIRTYLLERSRLIFQPTSERNYHIFYQLCAGAPPSERAQLSLDECTKFNYLNQGNCSEIQGVNDFEEFAETQKALSTIGMSVQRQWDIFRVLASLLHLGNVAIAAQSRTNAAIAEDDTAFATATELLGVNPTMLSKWIVNKQIITRSDKIISKLTPAQAVNVRDSVAKFIYSSLFDWLVTNVNATLCSDESADLCHSFIGVLDIYGFEHFQRNSFEQFCINYANEKLQQEFNQHVFKLEQEEYVREQIDWQFIEFTDNQPCIALIEGKLGVLALLDEESRMPSGTDENFINKLYQQLDTPANKKYFKKPRFGQSAFTICHYAHDVTYETEGFLDKNRDNVPDEIMEVLETSTFDFLIEVQKHRQALNEVKEAAAPVPKGRGNMSAPKKPTLGSVFKGSLIELMTTINSTEVHYIRCIKPNEAKVAWKFEPQMTLSQLRACGVLETIHISSRGYPTRRTLAEFISRYYMLMPSSNRPESPRDYCAAILDYALKSPEKYQIGLTKVFFRAGQLALLEKARTDAILNAVTMIKKNFLARIYRRKYLALRHATITIQVKYRYILRLREKERALNEASAITIQRYWRGYYQRQSYKLALVSIIYLQAVARGYLTRHQFADKRKDTVVTVIQSLARGWLTRQLYRRKVKSVIFMQSCIRRRYARRELGKLRIEARSANHLKEVSYKLENKVVSLTQDLQSQRKTNEALKETVSLLESRLKSWKDKCKGLESKNRHLAEKIISDAKEQKEALQYLIGEKEAFSERCAALSKKINAMDEDAQKLTEELVNKQHEVTKLREELARHQARGNRRDSRVSTRRTSGVDLRSMFASKTAQSPITALQQEEADMTRSDRRSNRFSTSSGWPMGSDVRQKRATLSAYDIPPSHAGNGHATSKRISMLMQPSQIDMSNDDIRTILQSDLLMSEVVNDLIKNIAIPLPDMDRRYATREILFPAHIIGLCITQMWNFQLSEQLKKLLFNVTQTIQLMTAKFKGDYICVFWLSNVLELLSILAKTEAKMAENADAGGIEVVRVMGDSKADLRQLSLHIMDAWLSDLRTRANKLAVPAVVESQSLPGFISSDTGFFNKLMGQQSPTLNIDSMLTFLVKLWKTIGFYYLDREIGKKVILDVLDTIGMVSFNHLLMRKNFGTWKRGMQIQYNITRIEEWCKSHEIQQGADHLERLMQAAKLLQLQKNSVQDIEIMFEVCFLLNKAQVKKLITIYSTSDYENPISTEIMQEVMRRCDEGGAADESKLFLEVNANRAEDALHQVKPAITIERYIPAWLDLPHLSAIVGMDDDLDSASTTHSKPSDMHTHSPRESMHTTRSSRSTLRSSISTLDE